jgi:dGTPase
MLLEAGEPAYADGRGGVGQRFLDRTQPSLEAQLCNLADEIAYNAHDIDDGVRSGLITMEQLREVPLFEGFKQQALAAHAHLAQPAQSRRLLYESIRLMLSAQVYDVIAASQRAIDAAHPASADEARDAGPLLEFGADMREGSQVLKTFLLRKLYRHPQVMQTMELAKGIVRDLFAAYRQDPSEMQAGFAARSSACGTATPSDHAAGLRIVADYIAGMTDRFAAREHERLTGRRLLA